MQALPFGVCTNGVSVSKISSKQFRRLSSKIRAIVGEVQNLFCFEPVCTMVNSRIERGRKEGPHIIDTRLNSC